MGKLVNVHDCSLYNVGNFTIPPPFRKHWELEEGKLLACGTPEMLREYQPHRRAESATLEVALAMNCLPAHLPLFACYQPHAKWIRLTSSGPPQAKALM